MTTLRRAQLDLTRERILTGTERVLRAGEALTFARVAQAADLPERTVYRHFETREVLEEAAWRRVLARFANDRHPATLDEYCAHVREAFERFAADAELVRAILHSREVLALRRISDAARQEALIAVVTSELPNAPPRERRRLAATLRVLYSAPTWELLVDAEGLDARGAAETVALAARRLLGPTDDGASSTTKRRKR